MCAIEDIPCKTCGKNTYLGALRSNEDQQIIVQIEHCKDGENCYIVDYIPLAQGPAMDSEKYPRFDELAAGVESLIKILSKIKSHCGPDEEPCPTCP